MTVQKNEGKDLEEKISVLDTNIFLTGLEINLFNGIIYSTPNVIEEIRVNKFAEKNRNIIYKVEAAIASNKMVLKTPSQKYVQTVETHSKKTGDFNALSPVDIELIALTLDLKENTNKNVVIYTNDYSIENLCFELNLQFLPLMGKDGIKKKIIWEVYCPFCKTTYNVEDLYKTCEKCGLKLKRRKQRLK